MIDTTSLTAAATFLSANNLTCDINITDSGNLEDFAAELAPYFLLAQTRSGGKRGLRPVLPVNANGTIKTTAIAWEYLFNEDYILPGSFELSYIPLADRKPFVVQAIWRQQLTDDFGIIRTSEVRYQSEAADGPYEQHDLSRFCTRENHAVKVAAYIRSRRRWVTHTARWVSRAQAFNTALAPGDICRVRLERNVAGMTPGVHDFLYQVDRITQTAEGDVQIEATHLPIDEQGRSLVALDVAGTTGSGILLSSNKSGVGCDVNSSSDTTVPAETFTVGSAIGGGQIHPPDPGSLPPGGAPPADSPADGPDDTEDNVDDTKDLGDGERLTRDPETCEIVPPPCTNGIWTVSQINDNGDVIPGTTLTYANSLPINLDINYKRIEWGCADDPALVVQPLQGPDTCNPTNPVPPPNPASFYGWRAYVWMGGGLSYIGTTGPLIIQSDNPLVVLRVTNVIPYPHETVDWKVNWQLNFTAPLGTSTVFTIGLYNTQTGNYPPGGGLIGFAGGAVGNVQPFIYGHINFYPTQADYLANVPQTVLTWGGA